jgi:hypothetical protein
VRANLKGPDPVLEQRRLRMHDLLVAQAERAWEDHWWHATGDPDYPYYVTAVKAHLDAAEQLATKDAPAEVQGARTALVAKTRARCGRHDITVTDLPGKVLTTEERFQLRWQVRAEHDKVPEGIAVYRLRVSDKLRPANPQDDYGLRRPCPVGLEQPAELPAFDLECREVKASAAGPPRGGETLTAELDMIFRGQPIKPKVSVTLHRGADVIVTQRPPPNDAAMWVQADKDIPRGAVAVLLDYSGSMNDPVNKNNPGAFKIDVALRALEEVLRQMSAGTVLSVKAFGIRNEIIPVRAAAPWHGKDQERARLIDRLKELRKNVKEMNETPLVKAILDAKAELKEERFQGLNKTIIVLTDGMDNLFQPAQPAPPLGKTRNKLIAQRIKKEFDPGVWSVGLETIALRMVFFGNDPEERGNAEEQFKRPLDSLPAALGKWHEVTGQDKDLDKVIGALVQPILNAMRPRFMVHLRNGLPLTSTAGDELPISRGDCEVMYSDETGERWYRLPVPPGTAYQVIVQNSWRDLLLERGDCLWLRLRPNRDDPTKFGFERGLFSDQAWKPATSDAGQGWRLAVTAKESSLNTSRPLDLLVSLEELTSVACGPGATIRVPKPRFQWFQLTAANPIAGSRFGVRWEQVWGHPSPSWKLTVPEGWPQEGANRPAAHRLEAWWSDVPPRVDDSLRHEVRTDGTTLDFRRELKGQSPLRFRDGNQVEVESVDEEVWPSPGSPEAERCLVVRLSYSSGKPVWVELVGLAPTSQEHYFYAQAGKVTAVFRGITYDHAQGHSFQLDLVSIESFQKDARLRVTGEKANPHPVR